MEKEVVFEDIKVTLPELRVWRGDEEIQVSMHQLRLLLIMMSHPFEYFTTEELVERLNIPSVEGLTQVIMKLRQKLDQKYIVNLPRCGYAFTTKRRS